MIRTILGKIIVNKTEIARLDSEARERVIMTAALRVERVLCSPPNLFSAVYVHR